MYLMGRIQKYDNAVFPFSFLDGSEYQFGKLFLSFFVWCAARD
jgi:hypothetical protein